MVTASAPSRRRTAEAVVLASFFLLSLMSLVVQAADSDGDGIQDNVDDCPWAAGDSSVDKNGCPDNDGDGTSDFNDPWAIGNPNYQNEFTTNSNSDYYGVDYSPSGEFIVTGSEDGFVRIWNASTWTNIRSVNAATDVNGVDWSPDGNYIAAALNDDTIDIYHSSNLTSVHGSISVDVGGGDQVNNVEFSPDSTGVAVAIGRSGNGGTNGEVAVISVQTGTELYAVNPNGEDRFYDLAHSPDGRYMALAGNSDIYIVNTSSQATTWSISNPPAAVNAIAWSPDGNYISMCGGWEGQSSSFDMYQYVNGAWSRIWQKTMSTSCGSTTFSSDSTQVVAGMYWYQSDGATAYVYQSSTGNQVDSFSGPRPGVAPLETTTSAASFTGSRGVPMPPTLSRPTAVTMRVFTTGSQTLTKTTTATTPPIRATASSTHSLHKEHNGTTPTVTVTGTIPHQLTNPMHVQQPRVRPPKTGTAVLMVTAMDGPMLVIGIRSIPTNGSMQTAMDTETTTSSSSMNTSTMSTSPAMPSPTMRRNGTIPMATVTVTTTKMRIGTNTARLNGQAFV